MGTENQSLFLVLGHARSGTTALARMLNEASKIACLYYESNLLYRLWQNLSRVNIFSEPLDDIVLDFAITAEHNLIQRAGTNRDPQITFSKDSVDLLISAFRGDLQSGDDEYDLFCKTAVRFFELFRKIAGKSIVGDKVPDYINIPDIIVPALPDCKVLYLKRDPRGTVNSCLQYLKTGLHLFAVPDAFAMANSMYLKLSNMESYLRHLHSRDKLTLSQENLENDPEQIAVSIMEFLGEPVCNGIRKFCRNMRRKSSVKDWRQDLRPDEIAAVESVFQLGSNHLDWHPVFNVKQNRWVEKATEIKTLIHSSTQNLSTIIREISPLFEDQNEKRSLGYTLFQFGTYEHIRQNFDRACIYFENASLHIPEDPILWFKFAELHFDQKSLRQARKYYQIALQSLPESDYFKFVRAKATYQLGKIERLQGSLIRAGEYFRKSLATFPQYKIARRMLESVSA